MIPDQSVVKEFEALLAMEGSQENAIQSFLEANTGLMVTPGLLNHRLHLNCVVSKFPLGGRIADYAYLTKSSDEWKLVLVELEDSHKKLFRTSSGHVGFSSAMNDAIAQIDVWRDYWKDNRKAVTEALEPLLVPPTMRRNTMSLECVLVIGRAAEKDKDENRRKRLAALRADKSIHVMTYDTLLRSYRAGLEEPKSVLTKNNKGYRLRSVEGLPSTIFAYIYPEHLSLDPAAENDLRAAGYQIDAWLKNEPLTVNDKWPLSARKRLNAGMRGPDDGRAHELRRDHNRRNQAERCIC